MFPSQRLPTVLETHNRHPDSHPDSPNPHPLLPSRSPLTMDKCYPSLYLHRFNCGHSESYHGILVSKKNILELHYPCARCEPNTPAGQERLENMWVCEYLPYLTDNGDIAMAPRGSRKFSALLSIRQYGDRYVGTVVSTDSAEGRSLNSRYGMDVGSRD